MSVCESERDQTQVKGISETVQELESLSGTGANVYLMWFCNRCVKERGGLHDGGVSWLF